jgi:aryl-alcohol dehydrogenase-like predicted oxidoreductase
MPTLGSTGLYVTPMGIGLAAMGRPGYINLGHGDDLKHDYSPAAMERRAHEVLDAAWAGGIRYFDAARSYGRGEEFLGTWLTNRKIDPVSVTVGSKWGYTYTAGWQVQAVAHEVKEHSLAVLRRQRKESAAFLGDYLDLYQIHSATFDSGVLENAEVLNELVRIKTEGIHIGLSLSGPEQGATLRRAMEIKIDGVRVFEAVQATWNLLEPSAGPALSEAHDSGMGVIIKEALANGRLTGRNTNLSGDFTLLQREAAVLNMSIDCLVLAVTIAQPFVDVVLSGAVTVEQLFSNLAALKLKVNESTIDRLKQLAKPANVYWAERKRLEWN